MIARVRHAHSRAVDQFYRFNKLKVELTFEYVVLLIILIDSLKLYILHNKTNIEILEMA